MRPGEQSVVVRRASAPWVVLALCLWSALTAAGAAELVVDLDARDIQRGSTVWRNRAGRGDFTCLGAPGLKVIDNVTAVTFDGQKDACRGPVAPAELVGASPRTIEAWVYNLAPNQPEKTIVALGRRGGPDGTNLAFNCGTHQAWGAAAQWGQGRDISWCGMTPTIGHWHHVAYTYDGQACRLYRDGLELTVRAVALQTHAGQPICLAAQNDETGKPAFGNGFTGPLAIAAVRLYHGALTGDEVQRECADGIARLGIQRLGGVTHPTLFLDPGGHTMAVGRMAFTSDGRHLLSTAGDLTVRVWDVASGACERVFQVPAVYDNRSIWGLNLFRDGRTALILANVGPRLYDWTTGKLIGSLWDMPNWTCSSALSPDERTAAVGCWGGSIHLFDVASGRYLGAKGGWDGTKWDTAFSPDGRFVAAAGSPDHVALWPMDGGGPVIRPGFNRPWGLDWSPDGTLLACVDREKLSVMRPDSGERVFSQPVPVHLRKPSFSPDGRYLAVSGSRVLVYECNGWGKVLDAPCAGILKGHCWSPDSRQLAVGSDDGSIRLVDVPSGTMRHTLAGTGARIYVLAWSPDSRSLAWSGQAGPRLGQAGALAGAFHLVEMTAGDAPLDERGWQRSSLRRGEMELKPTDDARVMVYENGQPKRKLPSYGDVFSATFTPSGRVMQGSYRRIWDTGEGIREYIGHTGTVDAMAVSPDGRYLATGANDMIIRVWNLHEPDGELTPLLRLFVDRNREWIVWTEEGYYACSPNAERMIGWQIAQSSRVEPEYYPAYQLRDRLYRPDIIARLLEAGSVEGAIRLADANRKVATDPRATVANLARIAPPKVTIVSPADGSIVTAPQVSVVAKVVDPNDRAIREVKVFRNGRAETTRGMRPKLTGPDGVQREMALAPGLNVLSVVAVNDAGLESCPVGVVVKYQPAPRADLRQSRLHLLAVGVSRYRQADLSLRYAAKDARDLAALLAAQQGKLYDEVTAKVLTDAEATRGNVLDALDQMGRQAEVRDTCLLFLAGHGVADDQQRYYFLPSDGDPDKLARSGLRWSELTAMVADLPGKVILALDTCHSGSVEGTRGLRPVLAYNDAIREAGATEVGVVTLASCQANELSLEREEWANGAFTKALLEAFEGKADVTGDGEVSLAELEVYVLERVKLLTGGRQHPTMVRAPTIPGSLPVVRLP